MTNQAPLVAPETARRVQMYLRDRPTHRARAQTGQWGSAGALG